MLVTTDSNWFDQNLRIHQKDLIKTNTKFGRALSHCALTDRWLWQVAATGLIRISESTRRTLLRQTLNGRNQPGLLSLMEPARKGFYGWFSTILNSGFISNADCFCLIYSSCYPGFILLVLEFYFYFIPLEIQQFWNVEIPVLLTLETSSHKA